MSESHGMNHRKCWPCWFTARGFVEPHRVKRAPMVTCCWCGRQTNDGIYVRAAMNIEVMPFCCDLKFDRTLFLASL